MPKDSKGRFHLNVQRAHAADRMAAAPKTPLHEPKAPTETNELGAHEAENKGLEEAEDQPIGRKLMEQAAADGGKHMHITRGDAGYTTHHVAEDGEVEGPHDHANIEALKEHLIRFFDEEEAEQGEY